MARGNPFLFISFLLLPLCAWSDTSDVSRPNRLEHVILDVSVSRTKMQQYRTCNQDISINAGYRNIVATARFTRNHYSTFVNSWLVGYRYEYAGRYAITASTGFSDVAFRKRSIPYRDDVAPSNYTKAAGICGQVEVAYRFHFRNKSVPLGITASYAYHYNAFQPLHLYGFGLKLFLLPHQPNELKTAIGARKEKKKPVEAALPKNLIRTKLLFGLYTNSFVEYERKVGEKYAWSVALAAKYNVNRFLGEMLIGPDAFLKGVEVNAGFYQRFLKPRGWWTLGVKGAYRHREGYRVYDNNIDHYMDRISDDIIAAYKISFSRAMGDKVNFEFYNSAGVRWSYRESAYHGYFPTYNHWLTQTSPIIKEWVRVPYIQLGLNIGFGW